MRRLAARAEPPAAMSVTVTLAGPAPWGFRITGGRDFGKPITVSKVAERGKAAAGDLRPGDVIVSINGESAAEMLNVEAQNKIKQSPGQLQLQVERSPAPSPGHTNGESSPERLAARFQDVVRTREESRGPLRSSCSSPASLSPRPGSPGSPGPGAANGRGEPVRSEAARAAGAACRGWSCLLPTARRHRGSGPPRAPGRCLAGLHPLGATATAWARSRPCGASRRTRRCTRCCRRTGSCGPPRGSPTPSACCRRPWRRAAQKVPPPPSPAGSRPAPASPPPAPRPGCRSCTPARSAAAPSPRRR
ncbi:PDZ and LIM domain protein 2 isoform X4 [Struthio camelus]|uniref:PDZ and LIM domain protein 2 isoform X4 n=1 Tax=Struthio camelus TaxID=8801 RepID=UPI003604145F